MKRTAGATVVGVLAVCVFWRTAFPSIMWWDSSSYSLAAATFGVSSSPGSLLLMLLGWPIAHLPLGSSPAYRLNLFAGVLAAVTAAGVFLTAVRVLRINGRSDGDEGTNNDFAEGTLLKLGAGAGALAFAFGSTMWEYAVMFTPYVLTVVFTIAMLYTLLRWWQDADLDDSWKWFALLGLLFGLDFSVHRTNALLFPGALVFILIRNPRAVLRPRAIVASVGALFIGLSVHLLLIPIARFTKSELNFGNPRDFTRFMEYVRLPHDGGGFFVKIFPRNADVWTVQVKDFLSALGDNAMQWSGPASFAGVLPVLAALVGVVAIGKRNRRLALALILLLLLQAVMTVLFFNIPANYFRSLARHYLPVWTTIGVLIACGLGAMGEWVARLQHKRAPKVWAVAALMLIVPVAQLVNNWRSHDASNRYFTRDYAVNALEALPPNAIHFTVGDNDTFPLMYMQQAEQMRPDVRIVNTSVMNYGDFPDQRRALDPSFPTSISGAERKAMAEKPWPDSLLVMAMDGDNAHFGLPADTARLTTVTFKVKPRWVERMLIGDITFLDIVRTNRWRRPITFATTATRSGMSWLEPYGRLEGIYWRIVPIMNPKGNLEALRNNLMSKYSYRGYADSTVMMDDVSAWIGASYYEPFTELAASERARGDSVSCQRVVAKMIAAIPPRRLALVDSSLNVVAPGCR